MKSLYVSLTKAVRSAQAEGRDWRKKSILNYRTTPHSTTGVTPAELLFGRKIATKLPELVVTKEKCLTDYKPKTLKQSKR